MKELGVSIGRLAKGAGVPESSIKNIIYGKSSKPRTELIEAIAGALQCEAKDLLSDDDPRRSKVLKNPLVSNQDVWNAELHSKATDLVKNVSTKRGIILTCAQAHYCIGEVYTYALVHARGQVDECFVDYVLAKVD